MGRKRKDGKPTLGMTGLRSQFPNIDHTHEWRHERPIGETPNRYCGVKKCSDCLDACEIPSAGSHHKGCV